MSSRRVLWLLVVVTACLRLLWSAGLELGHDEAYYSQFIQYPDWSYHDHPPLLAVVEWLGVAAWGRTTAASLRAGFILLFAGSTLLMARLGSRLAGEWGGVVAAVLLNATAYYGLAAGTFVLPDGPLLFFWLLTLDRLVDALELDGDGRSRPGAWGWKRWVGVGLAWGCALLSKYQAVLLPVGTLLYLVIEPGARRWLRHVGPYLAVSIGVLMFLPVVVWNAQHGWVSFVFQGGRAVGSLTFRPDRLATFLAGQCGYLLPWVWVLLVGAAWRRGRGWIGGSGRCAGTEGFLMAQAVAPILGFGFLACFRPVLPHWSLPGFLSLMPLLAADWVRYWGARPGRLARRGVLLLAAVWVGAGLFVVQARWGLIVRGSVELDPTRDLHGWGQVARALEERGLLAGEGTFVFTSKWYHSGHLAYELGGRVPVLCYSGSSPHGYAQWSRPADWVGWDGILVVAERTSTEPQAFDRWFERIEPAGGVEVVRGGAVIRRVEFYRCVRQTQPFPFDGQEDRGGDGKG